MAPGHNCNWFSESKNHTTLMCVLSKIFQLYRGVQVLFVDETGHGIQEESLSQVNKKRCIEI